MITYFKIIHVIYKKLKNLFVSFQVVLVNVVHLRDPVCPLPTSVLAQYLKQSSGQLSCLKVGFKTDI